MTSPAGTTGPPRSSGEGAGSTTVEAPNALDVVHVSASYGPYRALFDVSFTVPARGMTALIGSNGAGKSTVSRVVTGLLPSTSGTMCLNGEPITGLPAYKIARAGTAHVPEGRGIFASLTVEENLRLVFRQRGGRRCVPDALARAYEAFPALSQRRGQGGGTLSGGEQRMLSLAKVLVLPPSLLIADEISLGLAPVVIDAVYEGLRQINQAGTALLVVEQQVDRVLDLAGTAVVLEHGTVAYSGNADGALAAVEQVMAARGEKGPAASTSAGVDWSMADATRPREVGGRRRRLRGRHANGSRAGSDPAAEGEEPQ